MGGCPATCDQSPPPDCFDCDGALVEPLCTDGITWSCPTITCPLGVYWAKTAGGSGYQEGKAIGAAPDGTIAVAGVFGGSIDIGGGPLLSVEPDQIFETDIVLAKLLHDGTHVWSRAFGALGDDTVENLAVDQAGNIVMTGTYRGALSFDGAALPDGSGGGMYVVKLDPNGKTIFAKGFVGGANGTQGRLALTASGDILVGGVTSGTIDFGGGPLVGDNGITAFVALFSTNGDHLWSRLFAGTGGSAITDVAVGPTGDLVAAGVFTDTLDFGLGPLQSEGGFDVFVVRMNESGKPIRDDRYGGPGDEGFPSVVVDPLNSTLLTAAIADGADFGAGAVKTFGPTGVIVRHSPSGYTLTHKLFQGVSDAVFGGDVFRLAMSPQGNAVFFGQYQGWLQFPGGPNGEKSAGDYDLMMVGFDAEGQFSFVDGFGSENAEMAGAVAIDPMSGALLVTGGYWGSLDFGEGAMVGDGNGEMFVARLPPQGGGL